MSVNEMRPGRVSLLAFHPSKGMYRPGETAALLLELETSHGMQAVLELRIFREADLIFTSEQAVSLRAGQSSFNLEWDPGEAARGGFGVELCVRSAGTLLLTASTALDFHESWIEFPRYGFLMDFSPQKETYSFQWLKQMHVNGLQFYDWQFRHDALVPEGDLYLDPFGREMSLDTVRRLIAAAHDAGMAAMPYLAVYAASLEFWRENAAGALYGEDGEPLTFHDFLGYMDPSPGASWTRHLLEECTRVEARLDFDGFHVDQYGEPKRAWNSQGQEVDLPGAFNAFIAALKQQTQGKPVVFNAVGNWPIDDLAASEADFMYIEIWPPDTRYEDLATIVRGARQLSNGKPVVIALYIPADRPENLRLAEAVLFASGAAHILAGEEGLLLTDPYFPESEPAPRETVSWLHRYWDFLIRYQRLLGPEADQVPADRYEVDAPEVQLFVRRRGDVDAVQVVNFSGIAQKEWDKEHGAPDSLEDLVLSVRAPASIAQVWAASPDSENPGMVPLAWDMVDGNAMITIPECTYWTGVFIQYSSMEQVS